MARKRSRRRVFRKVRRSPATRFLAVVGVLGLAMVALLIFGENTRRAALAERNAALASIPAEPEAKEAADTADASERTIYPHSIVPGGVQSVEELKAAIKADPVVASHFSNFDLSRTRVEPLKENRIAHVSYRLGNEVFWTRRQVLLRAGEKVITDGENTARTRCGNQLSETALVTSVFEPPAAVLDNPEPPFRSTPPVWIAATNGSPKATDGAGPGPSGSTPSGNSTGSGTPGSTGSAGPGASGGATSGGGGSPTATGLAPGENGQGNGGGNGPNGPAQGPPDDPGNSGDAPGHQGDPGTQGNPGGPGGDNPGNPGNPGDPGNHPGHPGNPGNQGNPGGPGGNGDPGGNPGLPETPIIPPSGDPNDPIGDPNDPPGGDNPITPSDSGDPNDPNDPNNPGDPNDPGNPGGNQPASVPEPGTTMLMLAGGGYVVRRMMQAR